MRIEPLAEAHDRRGFKSGAPALDRYFLAQAGQDMRRHLASCFVATEGHVVVGYYTLAATSLVLADLPANLQKRLPGYPHVPAALLGRLAVDRRNQGRRLGEHLLMDALARVVASEIAAYAVVVDAKPGAEVFYQAYGFRPLTADGRRLLLSVAEIARLFG